MRTITYDQFDKICEDVKELEFKPDGWFPTVKEIKENIEPNIHKMLNFVVWIIENNEMPKNKEDKESFILLNKIIKENYNFIE